MTPAPSRSLSHLFAPSRTLSHLLALVLASAALFAQGFDRREETSEIRTFRYSGNGMRTLAIRNISGSIRVAAAGINDVRMNIRRVATADDAEGLRQAAREVTLGTSDGGLDVAVVVSEPDSTPCGEPRRERSRRDWGWRSRPPYQVRFDFDVTVPLLAILGAVIAFKALVVETVDGEPVGRFARSEEHTSELQSH